MIFVRSLNFSKLSLKELNDKLQTGIDDMNIPMYEIANV